MNVQDHTTPSGHENHGVHLCPRCGWPFPNPHPSAKHRRSHKKICGTIEGYTILSGSDVVSDDEHHPDDDKEKTPSPKIEKKISIGGDVSDIRGSFSRSEEDLFSDAVTEFPDSGTSQGSAHKTLDRDLFFSFNDAENGSTNVLNAPVEISKVDANIEVSEKLDTNVEKIVETKITKLELIETDGQWSDGLVKDEVVDPTPENSYVSQSQEAESIDVVVAGEEKVVESQTYETVTEETKDSKISKTTPEVSAIVGGYDDNGKPEIEFVCESVSEVKESDTVEGVAGISEEIKLEKIDLDHEITSEIVKESEIIFSKGISDEIKYAPEVTKESEIEQNVLVLNEKEDFSTPKEQIQEVVIEPVSVLSEIKDREAPESEKCSKEQIQEIEKEPDTGLTEKEDHGGPHMRKQSNDEKPDSIPIESQDLVAPILERCSKEIVVEEPVSILTETQNLVAPELEKCSKETARVITEQKVDDVSNVVADVSVETISLIDSSDISVANGKIASDVVPEPTVEESNSKLINNKDSGADFSVDSSSRNSIEGNWGSVSVLSTASMDAESLQTTEKSKVNTEKSIPSDTHSPPTFMTLVEPESKDKKSTSSEVQDLKQQPLTRVNNESEVRNKNEEAIAKVSNWSTTGKQSTLLKNLLGEAKSPSGKQLENVEKNEGNVANEEKSPSGKQLENVEKNEGNVANEEVNSPPKLIDDGEKGRKKVKGKGSWMPFVCCSSVNVVN